MSLNHTSQYAELTDDHFKAIGKLVVEWSNIEFLLRLILGRMLFTPDFPGRTLTDGMAAARVHEAIREAADIHKVRYNYQIISEEIIARILALTGQIIELRSARNKFAHFCWSRSSDEEIFGTNFSGGALGSNKHKKSTIFFKLSDFASKYQEAHAIVDELSKIVSALPTMAEDGIGSKLTPAWAQCLSA